MWPVEEADTDSTTKGYQMRHEINSQITHNPTSENVVDTCI